MKRIQYPNGYIGTASDKVVEILSKRPGHKIIEDKPQEKKPQGEVKK